MVFGLSMEGALGMGLIAKALNMYWKSANDSYTFGDKMARKVQTILTYDLYQRKVKLSVVL
jgi:hypothetical protein